MRVHNSTRGNEKISGEKVKALLVSNFRWDNDHDPYCDDGFCRYSNEKLFEVELTTVNNSLCEGKMNFTLHPGQMCAGGEEGREYCQEKLKTNQKVLKMLISSDKVRAKQSLSLWANTRRRKYKKKKPQSGGPLTVKKKTQHVLIGTAISGLRCGQMDKLAVFSMISHYRDWIMKNMKNPKFCQSGPDAKE